MTDISTDTPATFPAGTPEHTLLNDAARRVHTVMCVAAEKYALLRPEKALSHNETIALINGAVSGIAVMCAQMNITMSVAKGGDASDLPPPEVFLAEMISEQFIEVYAMTVQNNRDVAAVMPN